MVLRTNKPAVFFPGLESLRGIAAIVIAMYHISWRTHLHPPQSATLVVDFFFVLSGFVMMHTYHERLNSFQTFLTLRVRRLYPLHLATLLCVLGIELAKRAALTAGVAGVAPATRTASSFVANLLLLHGLGPFAGTPWNVPSWSISAEFWTYIVFAILCRKGTWLVEVALMLTGFSICWTTTGDLSSTAIYAFPRCLFGFFSGVLAWRVYRSLAKTKITPSSYWPLAAAILFLAFKSPGREDFLAIPLFMALIVSVALSDAFNQQRLVALGTISYSIYMTHPLVIWPFEFILQYVWKVHRDGTYQIAPLAGDALSITYLAAVLLVSRWTYIHIESRFRKKMSSGIYESNPQSPAAPTLRQSPPSQHTRTK